MHSSPAMSALAHVESFLLKASVLLVKEDTFYLARARPSHFVSGQQFP